MDQLPFLSNDVAPEGILDSGQTNYKVVYYLGLEICAMLMWLLVSWIFPTKMRELRNHYGGIAQELLG